MGIKFRGMTPQDYRNFNAEVKASFANDAYEGLNSRRAFGFAARKGDEVVSQTRNNVRAYYKLHKPVINFVLGRSNCTLLGKILGVKGKTMTEILEFASVWLVSEERLVRVDEVTDYDEVLLGPEILEHFIETFDFKKALEEEFLSIMKAAGISDKVESISEIGTLNKDGDGLRLAGGYYIRPHTGAAVLKRGHKFEDIPKYIEKVYLKSDDSRLTYLLNSDKEKLMAVIQRYITVLPPGMRPSIQNRNDPWTEQYARVIKANQEVELVYQSNTSIRERITKYNTLVNAVKRMQYKTDKAGDKSPVMLAKLKGKKGRIRGRNLGKRQDYTARSAVIVNPFLSMTKIRIPREIAPKLFRYHILPYVKDKQLINIISQANDEECLRIIEEQGLLNKIPVWLGRQPTLHKQSLQGFWAELTDAKATEVSPLVCPAFNMDFDGDTGHIGVPLSSKAIKEVTDLIMTYLNIFLAKSGECTICPRQDILYGLYTCTRSNYPVKASVGEYSSYESVREAVINHKVKVYDTVTVGKETELAGYIAFKSCFPKGMFNLRGRDDGNDKLVVKEINAKTIKTYVNALLERDRKVFTASIDSMVELGFKIAKLYSPSMSLLTPLYSDTDRAKAYDTAMEEFHKEMAELDELYDLGLEDDLSYNLGFNSKFKNVEDKMKAGIRDKLGVNNGYWKLADSGARGNESNLVQMFAYKGRIAKSSTESFNAIIENSLVSQLTPLEHFITAYGGRKGQMDKTLKTGDTGYAMRQMWHTSSPTVITNRDCGTTQGIWITKADIAKHAEDADEINVMFKHFIKGRFQAGTNRFITDAIAEQLCEEVDKIEIRSPITCLNPCCQKCYGTDPSTHKDAVIGLPAGIIAAHSIGEPGTQLTMKQFQKGGVAGKGDVTSNFDRLDTYMRCSSLSSLAAKGKYPMYDPLAWADGEVHEVSDNIVSKKITIGDDKKHSVILPREAIVKTTAKKGEGLCLKRGDYSIDELLEYTSLREAQIYLIYKMYTIYKSECMIVSKHFEVMVSEMTRHMIIETDRDDLKVGQYYSTRELLSGSLDKTKFVSTIKGLKEIPLLANSAVENIAFENISKGLSKAVLLGTEDKLEDPIPRMVMGLPPKAGTYYSTFMEDRKRA